MPLMPLQLSVQAWRVHGENWSCWKCWALIAQVAGRLGLARQQHAPSSLVLKAVRDDERSASHPPMPNKLQAAEQILLAQHRQHGAEQAAKTIGAGRHSAEPAMADRRKALSALKSRTGPRASSTGAAGSHLLNDAYMARFEEGYAAVHGTSADTR